MQLKVNWMRAYGNNPYFVLEGAEAPKNEGLWERADELHRRDHKSGFVDYFFTDGRPTSGFGGRVFEGGFMDGTTFQYQGAWSSRAAVVNQFYPERPIVDLVCSHYHCAMTVEAIVKMYLEQKPTDFKLAVVQDYDVAPIVLPVYPSGEPKNPRDNKVLVILNEDGSNLEEFMGAFKNV